MEVMRGAQVVTDSHGAAFGSSVLCEVAHSAVFERSYPSLDLTGVGFHDPIKIDWEPYAGEFENVRAASLLEVTNANGEMVETETHAQMLTKMISIVAKPISDSVLVPTTGILRGMMTSTIMDSITHGMNNAIPPHIANGLYQTLAHTLTSKVTHAVSAGTVPIVSQAVAARVIPYMKDRLTGVTPTKVSDLVARAVSLTVPHIVPRVLVRMLVPFLSKALVPNLIQTITRSVTHSVVPPLTNSLTQSPTEHYYCYFCYHKKQYCKYCTRPEWHYKMTTQYGEYYTSYFMDFYSDMYAHRYDRAAEGETVQPKEEKPAKKGEI